jgi:hypothetical protein
MVVAGEGSAGLRWSLLVRDVFVAPFWPCSARRDGQPQRCGRNPTVSELEKIMGGADKSPLGAHLFEAAQQELAESARLFDLSEHRLGQLLAQPVGAGVSAGLDLGAHGFDAGRRFGRLS